MFYKVTSKRTPVLMALFLLAVTLLVVSANSAYADNFADPVDLPFSDDFGNPPAENDVPNWSEIEDQDDYCATKNYHGDMFLKLRNGCDAYVTIEMDPADFGAASSLFLTYDWGQHATGDSADDGDLSVYLTISGTDEFGAEVVGTLEVITYAFEPKLKIGPINHVSNHVDWGLGYPELAGRAYTLEVHFVGTSEGKNDWALVDNVRITRRDALPRGTYTAGQGRRGSSIDGEPITCDVIETMSLDLLGGMDVDAVTAITTILASPSVNVDTVALDLEEISSPNDLRRLCDLLIGEEGNEGGNNDAASCRPARWTACPQVTWRPRTLPCGST